MAAVFPQHGCSPQTDATSVAPVSGHPCSSAAAGGRDSRPPLGNIDTPVPWGPFQKVRWAGRGSRETEIAPMPAKKLVRQEERPLLESRTL
jgi:hypothetical protein